VEEVKKDIDLVHEIVSEVRGLSWRHGFGGEITPSLVSLILKDPEHYPDGFRSTVLWLYAGGKNVFLQDANSLVLGISPLVEILGYLKGKFPFIERITTYARAKTVSKKTVEELQALWDAGLSRIHIGLETGYDPLLQYIKKGVTAQEHIDAGKRVKASGISLSEYVILGLGGKGMWKEHAIETAKVLNQINPDFIRVRTLKVLKIMPLYKKLERGDFILLNDDEIVTEERLLIEGLDGITSFFASDHILNLLEEVEGKFPEDKRKMLGVIDRYLALPPNEKAIFRLGRRGGVYRSMDDLSKSELKFQLEETLRRIEKERPSDIDQVLSDLMESFI
jgi:radical SAM superfamily enzyme YgiQ (UPF0313 family)